MLENPPDSSSSTTNNAAVKRYAPPNQRNRSLGRRKSGGGMEQIGETQNQKKVRINWKIQNVEKTFLETCIHEVAENGREGASLKALSWKKVGEILKSTHNFIVDQKQMKNHYDYLKGKYGAWAKLKSKTGNIYDPSTNMFNLSDDEWNIEIKENKYVESLRSTPLVFSDLCAQLFDGVAATGINSQGLSSMGSRSCAEPIMIEEDIQDINEAQDIPTSTPICSSSVAVQRPTKKSKVSKNSKLAAIEDNMSKLLKLIIEKNSGSSKPSFKDCQDKLRGFGWGAHNPLHQMALIIFTKGANYREAWMELQADEVENWVRMLAKMLGIVV